MEKKLKFVTKCLRTLTEKHMAAEQKGQLIELKANRLEARNAILHQELVWLRHLATFNQSNQSSCQSIRDEEMESFIEEEPWEDESSHDPPLHNGDEHAEPMDEDSQELSLAEDTFSFLISSHICSMPFLSGALVFLFKNLIFCLLLFNLINIHGTDFNRLGVPVSVETVVAVMQCLALGICVLGRHELVTAVILLYQGYNPDMLMVYGRSGQGGGTRFQWALSMLCSGIGGLLGLTVSFLLIVTAESVLDVLLSFAAVSFVSSLDQGAFYLAQMGFFGTANKIESILVTEATYAVRKGSSRRLAFRLKAAGLLVVLIVVLSVWAQINDLQRRGHYMTHSLFVQFDDELQPLLAAHSGYYTSNNNFGFLEDREGQGKFGYCRRRQEWTFFLEGDDPCDYGNVLVKSSASESIDIADHVEPWFVAFPNATHFLPMENFRLDVGCWDEDDCGGGTGECIRNRCICPSGYSGFRCERHHAIACPRIELDDGGGLWATSFPTERQVATGFERLSSQSLFYDRPIFYDASSMDVLLFTGLRWAMTNLVSGLNLASVEELGRLDQQGTFDANDILSIDMLSEVVVHQSPKDRQSSPTNLNWHPVSNRNPLSDVVHPVRLICSVCGDSYARCGFGNACVNGTCSCTNGAKGTLCQTPPTTDGKCDEFFNTPEFEYDGGDCCQLTCVSTSQHECGTRQVQIQSREIGLGFPQCADPGVIGGCSTETGPCYFPNSQPVPASSTRKNAVLYPTLSANGRVLVVREPSIGVVRVFDLVGSGWVQRGRQLRGDPGAGFGLDAAVATPPSHLTNGMLPIVLVVSEPATGRIRLFKWGTTATDWLEGPFVSLHTQADPSSFSFEVHRMYLGYDFIGINAGTRNVMTLVVETRAAPTDTNVMTNSTREVFAFRRSPDEEFWTQTQWSINAATGAVSSDGVLVSIGQGNNVTLIEPEFIITDGESSRVVRERVFSLTLPNASSTAEIVSVGITTGRFLYPRFDRIGLNVVSKNVTGGVETVAVDYYELNQRNATWSKQAKFNATLGAPGTWNLADAVFSSDGTAAAIVYSNGQQDYHYRVFQLVVGVTNPAWREVATVSGTWTVDPQRPLVSISNGGHSLVDGSSGVAAVYETNHHGDTCGASEALVRLSIDMNDSGQQVSWRLVRFGSFFDFFTVENTFAECIGCYDSHLYSWGKVTGNVCVPRVQLPCVGVYAVSDFKPAISSFVAFTMDDREISVLASDDDDAKSNGRLYTTTATTTTMTTTTCPISEDLTCDAFNGTDAVIVAHELGAGVTLTIDVLTESLQGPGTASTVSLTGFGITRVACVASSASCIEIFVTENDVALPNSTTENGRYGVFVNQTEIGRTTAVSGRQETFRSGACIVTGDSTVEESSLVGQP